MRMIKRDVRVILLVLLWSSNLSAQTSITEIFDEGQYNLETGDVVAAMSWFRKAAEQNYAPAQVRLAWILDGSGDDTQAVDWYRKAAEQNFPEGLMGLSDMYIKGEGVAVDITVAIDLIEQAAEQNHKPAIRKLASAYEHGRLDLEQSNKSAIQWLERGVNSEDYVSTERLAKAYRNGELGLAIDEAKATDLETQAQSMIEFSQ